MKGPTQLSQQAVAGKAAAGLQQSKGPLGTWSKVPGTWMKTLHDIVSFHRRPER
ncbi:MAG: hypothetical protein U0996_05230 [Planctomycetaceae bacterium]